MPEVTDNGAVAARELFAIHSNLLPVRGASGPALIMGGEWYYGPGYRISRRVGRTFDSVFCIAYESRRDVGR